MSSTTPVQAKPAPIKATWITLVIAWVLFLLPIPGVGLFVGGTLNLVAFILAIVVMARGRTVGGLIPLLSSVVVSPIVYFIGLAIFGAALSSGSYKDYAERAKMTAEEVQAEASESEPASAPQAQPALEVSADRLFAAYEANEVAADNEYKGKVLAVSGNVVGINKDFTDEVYVEMETDNPFQSIHARGVPQDVAAGLQKGQHITVECVGSGLMVGSPILKDCTLL